MSIAQIVGGSSIFKISEALKALDTNDIVLVHQASAALLASRQVDATAAAAGQFKPGDLVKFEDRIGNLITMRVHRVNQKSLSGVSMGDKRKWRVHPSFCTLVGAHSPATPSAPENDDDDGAARVEELARKIDAITHADPLSGIF